MFGLREGNGREEKKNKGEGKNVSQSDKFFITFSFFLFYFILFFSCYPNNRKHLISLPFPPFSLKPNIV